VRERLRGFDKLRVGARAALPDFCTLAAQATTDAFEIMAGFGVNVILAQFSRRLLLTRRSP
jgi:hypothetical protein